MTGTRLNDCTPTPDEQAKYTISDTEREAQIRRNHSLAEFKNGWGESKTGYKDGLAYDHWKEKDDLFHLLDEARAEIARLRAPPEADVMEIAWVTLGYTADPAWIINDPQRFPDVHAVARALTAYGDQRAREAEAAMRDKLLDHADACVREARAAAFEEAAQIANDQTSDDPQPGDWNDACSHIRDALRALDAPPQSQE
jgi:hypothetical protein